MVRAFFGTNLDRVARVKGSRKATACKYILGNSVLPTLWQLFGEEDAYGCDGCVHILLSNMV